jgi:perosamine synthetase
MDPQAVEEAITDQTKAILPVEVFGNMAHFDRYEALAKKHNLRLLEDCCEALGGRLGDRPAGSFGDCGVFAFYPNKQITTGEGGMVVTDDDKLADLARSMRNQGRDTSAWLSHARLGYNYRMSEISAALGAAQAQRLDEILAKRRNVAGMYRQALGEVAEIHLPPMAQPQQASWFVYVIRLADRYGPGQRDRLMELLRQGGIGCNPYFVPIHLQPYVRQMLGTRAGQFPITERIAERTLALPFFSNMSQEQVERVKTVLCEAIKKL